jgi:hypothetical protein
MKYLTFQEIECSGLDSCDQCVDPLMGALLDLEAVDDAITDPDLAADLSANRVDIQMIVDASSAAVLGWETTTAVITRRRRPSRIDCSRQNVTFRLCCRDVSSDDMRPGQIFEYSGSSCTS